MQESLIQLACLKKACIRLGISYTEHDKHGNLISVRSASGPLYFANFVTPFNSGAVEQICRDKEFSYFLLHEKIPMSRTQGYFDPEFREGYDRFKKYANVEEIISDIESAFSYPLVVKKNTGTRGINVFLCRSTQDTREALVHIFKKDSSEYDYLALVQEYKKPIAEYRAVVFKGEVVLLYPTESLWKGGEEKKEMPTTDTIKAFLAPVQDTFPAVFFGADIILDAEGKLWLLELNSRPGFSRFIKDFGEEAVVSMYEKMLKSFF